MHPTNICIIPHVETELNRLNIVRGRGVHSLTAFKTVIFVKLHRRASGTEAL
jgi:hypothetical protein